MPVTPLQPLRSALAWAGVALLAASATAEPPRVTFSTTSAWSGGFTGSISIENRGGAAISPWQLTYSGGPAIDSIWNATLLTQGDLRTITAESWNATIPPGGTVSVGFTATGELLENVADARLNGEPVELVYNGSIGGGGGKGGGGGEGGGGGGGEGGGPPIVACSGDLDGDGRVDGADLGLMLMQWGGPGNADLDGDGVVNGSDLGLLLLAWGECPEPGGIVVAYWIEWGIYGRNYQPADTPFDKITHLNYAFARIGPAPHFRIEPFDTYAAIDKHYPGDSWSQPYRGTYNQLNNVLKPKHPHLKTLISVGGWTLSGPFSDAALTASSRAAFAAGCVDFIRQYNFDGVDLDWEYPVGGGLPGNTVRPEDRENFTLLLAAVREALDAAGGEDGRHYLLTIAAPAGFDKMANMEMAAIAEHLDWINVMTYDFFGAWDLSRTGHHGCLRGNPAMGGDPQIREKYNGEWAIDAWLAAGVPPRKLTYGLPFYGRAWRGVPAINHGLFQPATGVPPGTWDDWSSGATGVNDFTELESLRAPGSGYTRHWDAVSLQPWLYSPTAHGGHFIGYEDEESIAIKCDFARSRGLAGVMFWEITADRNQRLLDTVVERILAPRP